MNDGLLLVNFGALQNASADIQKALTEIRTNLDNLKSAGDPLVQTWRGEAQAAYWERQRKWTAAADDLSAILRNIQMAVNESAADYQNTETRNTRLFS